jgi:nicotinate-nucleotide adenylyltransferase
LSSKKKGLLVKIGLLGGTFDPVHNGHLALAERAYNVLDLDRVIFIPAYMPPHKDQRTITAVEHRVRMLELAIAGKDFFEISDFEIAQQKVMHTVDTLKAFRQMYPSASEFFFLVGSDFVSEYKTWKDHSELTKLATFVIAARPGFTYSNLPEGMQSLEGDFPLVSSTDIRIIIRNRENVSRYLPSTVDSYIKEHGLYS